ncbi:MAG TPA: T9SS type A sorting domain-containing protein, partial [Bacteroidia bacterium]|nr:T9SS type A sorting domain-containing protein [Bacteroidia bacterium]
SMLEDVVNPSPPYEQLNFLTDNGLKCWQSGMCGAGFTEFHASGNAVSPFTYYYPTDPEMQFMLDLHLATQAGSERWFHPISTGAWRPTTKVGVSTATGVSPNQGVLAVYGPAFGDTANGRVMYVAGHDLTSGGGGVAIQNKVSAIRTYFNFMLLAGKSRQLAITATMPPDSFDLTATYPVSVTVTTGTPPYTYEWTSQNGGSFESPNDSSTVYHPPVTTADTFDIVKIKVTDLCGRKNFASVRIRSQGYPALPVSLISFTAEPEGNEVILNWTTVSETNNNYFALERSAESINFERVAILDGAGNSSSLKNYSWTDRSPLSGVSYYRLIQTDFDGNSAVFGPISVRAGETTLALSLNSVFPNPHSGNFSVTYSSAERCNTLFEILAPEGKLLYSINLESSRGTNFIELKTEEYVADGIYFIRLSQKKAKPVTGIMCVQSR